MTGVRRRTYPAYNYYSNVFATGSVGYLGRTVNLTLPNGNAVITARRGHGRLFGSTTGLVMRGTFGCCRGNSRDMLPQDVTAHRTFLGTVALSVTVKKSAGAVLRLLTITRRTRMSFGVSSVSVLSHGDPYLYGMTPGARGCRVRSIGHTKNVVTVVSRLTGNKLMSAAILHMSKVALTRTVSGCDVADPSIYSRTVGGCSDTTTNGFGLMLKSRRTSCGRLSASHTRKYVHSLRRTCDGSNNLTMLGKGVTRSNYIIGATNISTDV